MRPPECSAPVVRNRPEEVVALAVDPETKCDKIPVAAGVPAEWLATRDGRARRLPPWDKDCPQDRGRRRGRDAQYR